MHNSAKMTQSHGVVVRMRRPSLKHPPDLLPPLDHRGRGEALEEELAVLLGQDAAVQDREDPPVLRAPDEPSQTLE